MKLPLLLTTLAILANSAVGADFDNRHLLLDQSLSDADAAASPYLFNKVQEALSAINTLQLSATDTLSLQIAPGVYWVDDPDDPAIRQTADNSTPYGFRLHASNLKLIGLSDNAEDIVLACNRGQTQGAMGNFTMFFMDCQYIQAENITFGNYCSVDLNYTRNPLLNRPRRANAIVQAQLIHTNARFVEASNCRFISRLNLCPFSGVHRALFTDCHFECTDDALEGSAIYNRCHFEFFSSKPFWGAPYHGPVFIDCQIDTHVKGIQYFMKTHGGLSLIRTNIRQLENEPLTIIPTYGQNDASCYYSQVTVNGEPAQVVGATDISQLPMLKAYTVENLLHGPLPTYMKWDDKQGVQFYCWNGEPAKMRSSAEMTDVISHPYGLRAQRRIHQEAMLEPAPHFVETPTLSYNKKGKCLQLRYSLDCAGEDLSRIVWYRYTQVDHSDAIAVHIGHEYTLSPADKGYHLMAEVTPQTSISLPGEKTIATYEKTLPAIRQQKPFVLETDFHDIPIGHQPRLIKGCWTFDAYKPADTQTYNWEPNPQNAWYYGHGVDGAASYVGLVQATRGARCFYTPMFDVCSEMSAELVIAPAKTAGQGFGSATGQYLDIGICFNPETLTGYALRIQRTPDYDRAVVFQLVQYVNGIVTPLSEAQVSTCYLAPCSVSLEQQGNKLTATASHDSKKVTLETEIPNSSLPALHSSFYMQHTGSTGPSASLIESLKISWK